MTPNTKPLLLLVTLINLAGCNARRTAKEYGFVFYEATGQNQYLLEDSRELPFSFDEVRSDRMALGSLRALSARILYPNSKGGRIILVGDYDAQTQRFRIQHWYLRVPFRAHVGESLADSGRDQGNKAEFTGADRFCEGERLRSECARVRSEEV